MINIPIFLFVMNIVDDLFNNPIRALISPFIGIYGEWFFTIVFGLIGIIYYRHSENIAGITGYLLIVGAFCGVVFNPSSIVLFGIITASGIGAMLFKSFITKHGEF